MPSRIQSIILFGSVAHFVLHTCRPPARSKIHVNLGKMASLVTRLNENDPSLRKVSLKSMEEIRCDEISQALRSNHTVKSFHIHEDVFDIEGFRSPTWRQLRSLLQSVGYMHNLEELILNGKMSLDNINDVQVIAKAIFEHPELREVKLTDFIIYANDHADTAPLLEPLLTSLSSIVNLEAFELRCFASYKRWSRSFMTSQALVPVCQSSRLQRLALTNVKVKASTRRFRCEISEFLDAFL
jgi:hypothetical protein